MWLTVGSQNCRKQDKKKGALYQTLSIGKLMFVCFWQIQFFVPKYKIILISFVYSSSEIFNGLWFFTKVCLCLILLTIILFSYRHAHISHLMLCHWRSLSSMLIQWVKTSVLFLRYSNVPESQNWFHEQSYWFIAH